MGGLARGSWCALALTLTLWPAAARAQLWLPLDDPAYRWAALLEARLDLEPADWSQRPFSRYTFARVAAAARRALAGLSGRRPVIEDYVEKLERRFGQAAGRGLSLHPLERLGAEYHWLRSARTRLVSPGQGPDLDQLNASVDPLGDFREGVPLGPGSQVTLASVHWAQYSGGPASRVALETRLAATLSPRGGRLDPTTYGMHLRWAALVMEFGRIPLQLGPGEHGGLVLSNNARPFEQVRLSLDRPRRLPAPLGWLGRWRPLLVLGTLGPEQRFPYTRIAGFRLAWLPVRPLALGFSILTLFGGRGAPPISLGEVLRDLAGIFPGTIETARPTSNRIGAADLRLSLGGWIFYAQVAFEDRNHDLAVLIGGNTSALAGLYRPDLLGDGALSLRLEVARTAPRAFTHSIFTDGFTLNGHLLGSNLGPQGLGARGVLDWEPAAKGYRLGVALDWESRDSDLHSDPRGRTSQPGPAERRLRVQARLGWELASGVELRLRAGGERVENWRFVLGRRRLGGLLALGVEMNLDRWTAVKR